MELLVVIIGFCVVPTCYQVLALVKDQRARHAELLTRLDRLEGRLGALE